MKKEAIINLSHDSTIIYIHFTHIYKFVNLDLPTMGFLLFLFSLFLSLTETQNFDKIRGIILLFIYCSTSHAYMLIAM
jgi:hypothetical protein